MPLNRIRLLQQRSRGLADATASSRSSSSAAAKSSMARHIKGDLAATPSGAQPLGTPLPYDEHACSVSLPTWASVVGYEEGDPAVTAQMKCGYPRFVYHPYVLQLMRAAIERHGAPGVAEDCLVLPSEPAAHRCRAFLLKALYGSATAGAPDNALPHQDSPPSTPYTSIRVVQIATDVFAVLFPAETAAGVEAKAYWQHTGEVVSSRRAEEALKELGIGIAHCVTSPYTVHHGSTWNEGAHNATPADPQQKLRERIADWAKVDSTSVFLTPSGMSAIYHALRASRRYQLSLSGDYPSSSDPPNQRPRSNNKGGTSIVYGFPYLDTLKMCSREEIVPGGVEFFGRGNERDLEQLKAMLRRHGRRNYCALLSEVPSNPLLQCPDLFQLRELANEYNFMLILDDTIANFLNVDLITSGLADAVCTSLTKLASGRGDAMGGSIVANPFTEKGQWLQEDLARQHSHTDLFVPDATAILKNSTDFLERNKIINCNAEGLADWLNEHEDVKTVYFPKFSSGASLFQQVQTEKRGYGGLLSLILHPHMCQRTFYDALDVAKGPSLGTDFTLVCPYTLLAHYHELDFAMSYDVPPNLVRVAVGLEPLEEMKDKFSAALRRSKLHPKMSTAQMEARRAYSTACPVPRYARMSNLRKMGSSQLTQTSLRKLSYFLK